MTILLLTEVFPPKNGGSGRWLWELYRRIERAQVYVVAGDAPGAESFDKGSELPIKRIPLHFSDWGVSRPTAACQYARALVRVCRLVSKHRPDEIHCGKLLPEGLVASIINRCFGIPFQCYVHGEELTLANTSKELRWLSAKVLRASTGIIANSHHTKGMLVNGWHVPDQKVTVMHPGVDTMRFRPSPPDESVRARLGWTGRRVVLTVGTLQKRKGQDMLIRALPAIRRRCPTVLYSMIGDGWDREYLERLVRDMDVVDAVQFRGMSDDAELVECYQQCDVFVLPNRQVNWDFEGFGIVLLEAQACGKPVIAGMSGGTAETMEPSKTGELVRCDEPDELARMVSELLMDSQRRAVMGMHAREWTVARFAWDVVGADYAGTFDRDLALCN